MCKGLCQVLCIQGAFHHDIQNETDFSLSLTYYYHSTTPLAQRLCAKLPCSAYSSRNIKDVQLVMEGSLALGRDRLGMDRCPHLLAIAIGRFMGRATDDSGQWAMVDTGR